MSLLELFCAVDDFWQAFEPLWRQQQLTTGEGSVNDAVR